MINIRIYADTSVFGEIYDDDFQDESKEFFEEVKRSRFTLITSAVVRAEIEPAPEKVKIFFNDMIEIAEIVDVSKEALQLRDAYLKAGHYYSKILRRCLTCSFGFRVKLFTYS